MKVELTKQEVRTILATIECFREQNHYRFDEMNRYMGNLTIEDMLALNHKLCEISLYGQFND